MKITFTAEAAEIAEQEPGNLCVLGGSFSKQITEATEQSLMFWLGALGVLGGERQIKTALTIIGN